MVHKAQSDAPDYRPANTPRRCENCVFFKDDPGGDFCGRFRFIADRDYVCDDWEPQKPDEIPGYQAKGIDRVDIDNLLEITQAIMVLRGGPGSGNWQH